MSLYPVFVHALSLHTVDILLCVMDQYIQNIRHIDLLLTKLLSVTAPYRCRCRPPGPWKTAKWSDGDTMGYQAPRGDYFGANLT